MGDVPDCEWHYGSMVREEEARRARPEVMNSETWRGLTPYVQLDVMGSALMLLLV